MPSEMRLSMLVRELQNAGYDCDHLTYRKLWEMAVQNQIPVNQITGRWHFRTSNVPKIAALLSLQRKLRAA